MPTGELPTGGLSARGTDPGRRQAWQWAGLLAVVTLSIVAGRIATVVNQEGDVAFQSANDRSRWATVAALVEDGTYAIDRPIGLLSADGRRHPWETIDKVRHLGADGKLHFYSSKPTLLPTMLAGLYAVLYGLTGIAMTEHPIYMPRLILLLVNVPVLAIFLASTMVNLVWMGVTGFARRVILVAACLGTMVTPFAVALNNHLFAAAATSLTLTIYLWIGRNRGSIGFGSQDATLLEFSPSGAEADSPPRVGWWSAVAGASAAFSVANELPSLAMFAMWGLLFAALSRRTILPFVAGAAIVAAAAFGTNWLAHSSWRTPYAHRGAGELVEVFRRTGEGLPPGEASESADTRAEAITAVPDSLVQKLRETGTLGGATDVALRPLGGDRFEVDARFEEARSGEDSGKGAEAGRGRPDGDADEGASRQLYLLRPGAEGMQWQLLQWDDWYDYPGSYWRAESRPGVDRGEPDRLRYLFHTTFGMYGVFSLTPLWLLVPFGVVAGCVRGPLPHRLLFGATALVTLVVFAFYLARPEIDRNYGGISICLRWLIWLAPLWLVGTVPVLRSLGKLRWMQVLLVVLLAASVFSVATSLDSPWQSPWIVRFSTFLGWLGGAAAG